MFLITLLWHRLTAMLRVGVRLRPFCVTALSYCESAFNISHFWLPVGSQMALGMFPYFSLKLSECGLAVTLYCWGEIVSLFDFMMSVCRVRELAGTRRLCAGSVGSAGLASDWRRSR